GGVRAAEGHVLDLLDKFSRRALVEDDELLVFNRHAQPAGVESTDEYDLLRVLADVDEPARAGELGPELTDVEIAARIDLGEAEESHVESAAVVEVELIGLIDHGLRVDAGAEVEAARRNAADHSRLRRQRDEVDDLLLVGDRGNAFGHADAEIDDAVGLQLEGGAPGDDLAFAHLHRRQRTDPHPDLAGKRRIVVGRERLPMVLRFGDDHTVDHNARHLDLTRIEAAAFDHALDLRDDDAARIAHGHGDGQRLKRQGLALHGEVAVGVAT